MMAGAMLQAASERRVVLVDGFIAARRPWRRMRWCRPSRDYLVFCHRSAERGTTCCWRICRRRPLLAQELRLGEGMRRAAGLAAGEVGRRVP